MSDWTMKILEEWDDNVCSLAKSFGLDWFPINYEIVDYYEMIGHMSYHGMPSHYEHWSYGKSFERSHQMYNLGMEGLPYELIINSNPSIAYLMRENPLYLQILIMAHCVGHSDFFKNNRTFSETSPELVVSSMRSARKRIKGYVENPNIGLKKVESFIDTLHSIRFQTERNNLKRESRKEKKEKYVEFANRNYNKKYKNMDVDKHLLDSDNDLLAFLIEYGSHFEDWELDIINIVKNESQYFIPQMKTKIMNEGWASFWHYKMMNNLDLPQEYHIPFLKSHNQVIRPFTGRLNPYHLGFHIFQKIEKEMGIEECFFAREIHNDESAIRCYLDLNDFRELNLFSYSKKREKISIDEVSDNESWKIVRDDMIAGVGVNSMPIIQVKDLDKDGTLTLSHIHDGRDLNLEYAEEVVTKIKQLWPNDVKFFTIIEEESWEI